MSHREITISTLFGSISYTDIPIEIEPCNTVIIKVPTGEKWLGIIPKKRKIAVHAGKDGKVTTTVL